MVKAPIYRYAYNLHGNENTCLREDCSSQLDFGHDSIFGMNHWINEFVQTAYFFKKMHAKFMSLLLNHTVAKYCGFASIYKMAFSPKIAIEIS